MAKVITYQSPSGSTIALTRAQIETLEKAGKWPKDHTGQEYCTVSYGLHEGEPSMSDEEIADFTGVSEPREAD